MNVRICGPNLRDQRKGQFHVHADGCSDLRKYGPQYRGKDRYGGDLNGNREQLVEDATITSVVEAVYDNGILDEYIADGQTREEAIESLVSDFWFAPCCEMELGQQAEPPALEGEVLHEVYECWVQEEMGSFAKLKSDDNFGVVEWFVQTLRTHGVGAHIHVVIHGSSEYDSVRTA